MKTPIKFNRFFSIDSPKAIKANAFGFLNAINYMAPSDTAGVGNLCSHASPGCIAICLGEWSGQAAMRKENETNAVIDSRRRKAVYFMKERQAYLREIFVHIARAIRSAARLGLSLVVRPNGSTDIAYERMRFFVDFDLQREIEAICGVCVPVGLHTIFSAFPAVWFVDYTKNPNRFYQELPGNYCLTFSHSEKNLADCLHLLRNGVNVAVIFADGLPETWNGFPVINGDEHDLRQLDPVGCVVGLTPKGAKARRDKSGFVVRGTISTAA